MGAIPEPKRQLEQGQCEHPYVPEKIYFLRIQFNAVGVPDILSSPT